MAACRIIFVIILLVAIGAVLIACSAAIIPYLVRHLIEQNVVLKNNSDSYNAWLTPQAPVYVNFYFFNLSNSEQLISNWSIKPHVKQIGPYVYREIRNKSDVEFGESGATIRYRMNKWYVFERNLSSGDENDTFTTLNLPLVTIATQMQSKSRMVQILMKALAMLLNLHLFETRSVHELLWGYKWELPPSTPDLFKHFFDDIIKLFNKNSTEFGVYVGSAANGTDDGLYEIYTGLSNLTELGITKTWNGNKSLSYWSTSYCNMINGTDGTVWHPFVSADERLYSFSSDLCRSIYLTCDKCQKHLNVTSSIIPVYRFTPPIDVFADSDTNPDNTGFCVSEPCFGSGVLDVSKCRDAPILMSEPHFYQAAQKYQDAIDGLTPNSDCQTFVEVEPNTGIAVNLARKVQVNAHIQYLKAIRELDNMNTTTSIVYPVFWLNEHAKLSNDDAVKFYNQVLKPVNIAQIVAYLVYAVGGALLLVAIVLSIVSIIQSRRQGNSCIVNARAANDDDRLIGADDDAQLLDAGTA